MISVGVGRAVAPGVGRVMQGLPVGMTWALISTLAWSSSARPPPKLRPGNLKPVLLGLLKAKAWGEAKEPASVRKAAPIRATSSQAGRVARGERSV